jgi:hypothetical protein
MIRGRQEPGIATEFVEKAQILHSVYIRIIPSSHGCGIVILNTGREI